LLNANIALHKENGIVERDKSRKLEMDIGKIRQEIGEARMREILGGKK